LIYSLVMFLGGEVQVFLGVIFLQLVLVQCQNGLLPCQHLRRPGLLQKKHLRLVLVVLNSFFVFVSIPANLYGNLGVKRVLSSKFFSFLKDLF